MIAPVRSGILAILAGADRPLFPLNPEMIDLRHRMHARWICVMLFLIVTGCSEHNPGPVASDFVLPFPGVKVCYAECPAPIPEGWDGVPLDTPDFKNPELLNGEYIATLLDQWYPSQVSRYFTRGTVYVWIYVEVSGRPIEVRLSKGMGEPALDSLTVKVATAAEFSPAMLKGDPIAFWAYLPVIFQ